MTDSTRKWSLRHRTRNIQIIILTQDWIWSWTAMSPLVMASFHFHQETLGRLGWSSASQHCTSTAGTDIQYCSWSHQLAVLLHLEILYPATQCYKVSIRQQMLWLKVKVAHTQLPSVGFRSWSRFLAVSLQVTWVINPVAGCHYFPPGLQLPPQPLRGLLPIFCCLVNRGTMGVSSLPKIVSWQHRDCDLNLCPSAPESSTLTTRLPSHPMLRLINCN